jgi:two-component system, sensor histidine kinase RegB
MQTVDVSWLVRLRWAAAAVFLLLALATGWFFHLPMPLGAFAVPWAAQVLSNVALSRWVARRQTVRASTVAAIMGFDTLLLTALLALSGGPSNPFSVLYLVDVALGAVVLPPLLTWGLLLCALACFGALFIPLPGSFGRPPLGHAELMTLHLKGMWVAFAVAAVTLVAFVLRVRHMLAEREAELARERERAVRRDRLASLGTLAAGTAHALGTPLSTIAVAARELERRLQGLPDAEDARLIREQVERCRRALGQMSAEAGQPAGEMLHPRPLENLLREALDGLPEADRVQIEMPEGLAQASAALPLRALGQSVQALVRNALQASPPEVPVVLRLELEQGRLRVEVEDRGEGMEPDVLARAGEPFFTTRLPGQGLGLGLFVARSLAEQLGGDLSLASTPAQGTRARLTLPLAVRT